MARVVDELGRTVLTFLLKMVFVGQIGVVRRFSDHMSVCIDYGIPIVVLGVIGIRTAVARDVLRVRLRRRPVLTVTALAVLVFASGLLSIRYLHILLLLVVVLMATITYLLPIRAVFIAIRIVSRLFHSFMREIGRRLVERERDCVCVYVLGTGLTKNQYNLVSNNQLSRSPTDWSEYSIAQNRVDKSIGDW